MECVDFMQRGWPSRISTFNSIFCRSSAAKKRSSRRGASGSAIDHQLDRIDVRRVVGGKEKHRFGKFFRLSPAAQRNSGRDEISELGGLLQ